jgi:signal transduction histidine kinase
MSSSAAHPLAHGNALQRRYYRWALPYYERIGANDPLLRQQLEAIDLLLYTRQGVWAWMGWLAGAAGFAIAIHAAGVPLAHALGAALLVWVGISVALLSAWLGPRQRARPRQTRVWRAVLMGLLIGVLPGLGGLLFGTRMARGTLDAASALDALSRTAPGFFLALLGSLVVFAAVWQISRKTFEQQLERTRLQQACDAATAHALEADLRLLQAQIHPHFVFNTLATLQHWVDRKDDRVGPLLRELTGFLRSSTEMLGRQRVPLREELQAVRHYLAILQQRLGPRLAWSVDADDALLEQPLPPGLVLTLVENALVHGLEPKIGGGSVRVRAQRSGDGWSLRVEDDGLGLPDNPTEGIGLGNVRRRLQLQCGEAARLTLASVPAGGTVAEVRFG